MSARKRFLPFLRHIGFNLLVVNVAIFFLSSSPLVVWQPTIVDKLLFDKQERQAMINQVRDVLPEVKLKKSVQDKVARVKKVIRKIKLPIKSPVKGPEPQKAVDQKLPFFLLFMNGVAFLDGLFRYVFYLRLMTSTLLATNLFLLAFLHFKPVNLSTLQCLYMSCVPNNLYQSLLEQWGWVNAIACLIVLLIALVVRHTPDEA